MTHSAPQVAARGVGMGPTMAAPPPQPQYYSSPAASQADQGRAQLDRRARKAFSDADKDKNGYITFREFLESLRELHEHVPYHDALAAFSKLDTDNDGRIVETEFVNAYLNGSGSFS